ncbi:MAG: hypothetical protein RLZZ293_386 [Pseudomonadota bacterium]|jgi:disulfide bond formation protein DsbB
MLNSLFRNFSPRLIFGLMFLFCLGSVSYAFYAQIYQGAEPCPLCIAQRIIYGIVGILSFIALINNCQGFGSKFYALLLLASSGFGIKTAYHHVWLQSLPPEQWPASCGMPLEVLYHKIPLTGFIHTILSGTAECAMVNWKIFGFSGPLLSLIGFIILAMASLYVLIYRQTKRYDYSL